MSTNIAPKWRSPKESPLIDRNHASYIYMLYGSGCINMIGIIGKTVVHFEKGVIGWLYDYELVPKLSTVEEAAVDFVYSYTEMHQQVTRLLWDNYPEWSELLRTKLDAYLQAKERSGK